MHKVDIKIGKDKYTPGDDTVLSVKVKEYHYPIYFERKNACVSCGAEGELVFVNIFGKEALHEVHPFEKLKCRRCGAEYSIKWDKSDKDNKLYPSAVDKSLMKDFLNNFKDKEDKMKEFNA
jgi:ribosomal protein L37E